MKNQALFSLKDKSKKLKCRLLQFLFGALRVKSIFGIVFGTEMEKKKKKKKEEKGHFVDELHMTGVHYLERLFEHHR